MTLHQLFIVKGVAAVVCVLACLHASAPLARMWGACREAVSRWIVQINARGSMDG